MSLRSMFKTEAALETGGIKINFGKASITGKRAGGSNKAYVRALRRKLRGRVLASLSTDEAEALLAEVYAETVITTWDGEVDDGVPLPPFSRENVCELFAEMPDLFAACREIFESHASFLPPENVVSD